jgi:hypothetical protein
MRQIYDNYTPPRPPLRGGYTGARHGEGEQYLHTFFGFVGLYPEVHALPLLWCPVSSGQMPLRHLMLQSCMSHPSEVISVFQDAGFDIVDFRVDVSNCSRPHYHVLVGGPSFNQHFHRIVRRFHHDSYTNVRVCSDIHLLNLLLYFSSKKRALDGL